MILLWPDGDFKRLPSGTTAADIMSAEVSNAAIALLPDFLQCLEDEECVHCCLVTVTADSLAGEVMSAEVIICASCSLGTCFSKSEHRHC